MKCSDVRWQLTEFLKGETTPAQDELIRCHLDDCSDCALRLVSNGRVDLILDQSATPWTANITKRVLSNYPVSAAGMMMVRHLSWVFVVSAGFAVGVFMFVRQLFETTAANSPARLSASGAERLDIVATHLTSSPMVNYVVLAVLATILCIALIALVDRPSRGATGTLHHSN